MESDTPQVVKESLRIVTDELRQENEQCIQSARHLDNKAISMLGWSGLALSIVSALQLTSAASPSGTLLIVTAAIAVLLYAALVLFCLGVLVPWDYHQPLRPDWDELYDHYFGKEEIDSVDPVFTA